MATVQWRPEVNALTTPQSYTVRFIPRNILGYDELAAEMARDKTIMWQLVNGNQVTLENAFSYRLSFNARLNGPDDPLPPVEDMRRVKVSASRTFVKETARDVRLERLPEEEKLPVISSAEDTVLSLSNVLNPDVGILTGSATAAYMTVTGGSVAADETLRIQAALDPADSRLHLSLLDMKENGASGDAVTVAANGNYTLPGFAGSAVSSLNITVSNYAGLAELIRSGYAGWLADVLVVKL